jgi:hypothetical protein
MADQLPAVVKLNKLWIFGPDQAGSYREHFTDLAEVFGEDIETRLRGYLRRWARSGEPGLCILTGNAGTGKTAAAQEFCEAAGGALPDPEVDDFVQIAPGRWVAKDLSGLLTDQQRDALQQALQVSKEDQALVCANEGVLRDAVAALVDQQLEKTLEAGLRSGAARSGNLLVVNVNRQRPTAPGLWEAILDYVSRPELWGGCDGCPRDDVAGCPFVTNAEALRNAEVRAALRRLVQLATGEAVPTLREVFAILAQAITGGRDCEEIKEVARDRGPRDLHAAMAYYALVLGEGLTAETIERSPLLAGIRRAALGTQADLEVDKWLRDPTAAPEQVRGLAGSPASPEDRVDLDGTRSHLDRVPTQVGTMTFHRLGETISTSEDADKVEAGLIALVSPPPGAPPAIALWRARIFFEGASALGDTDTATSRLLRFRYFRDLIGLARRAAAGADLAVEITEIVKGLNFLVTGFSSAHEGLVIPDPSCLFARNPGSYRPAKPSLVHSEIEIDRIAVVAPDSGDVEEILDVDHIEVVLTVDADPELGLRIGPTMYEAVREAAAFLGPVGQGIAEMADLRSFYGRLAARVRADQRLRVADPNARPPALLPITLPRFER